MPVIYLYWINIEKPYNCVLFDNLLIFTALTPDFLNQIKSISVPFTVYTKKIVKKNPVSNLKLQAF